MECLNLGCGTRPATGMVNVDRFPGGADVLAVAERLPFRDGTFALVHAAHVLEHIRDLPDTLREIHRVLRDHGHLVARVPYGLESLYNPMHRRAFSELTVEVLVGHSTDAEIGATGWRAIRVGKVNAELIFTLEALP